MDGPCCDLAQEADLTAQVVMEVSQAPVVTVVYPAMEEDITLFQNESLKPFQLKQSLSTSSPFHFNFKWKHGTRSFNRSVSDQHKYQLTLAGCETPTTALST